MVGEITMNDDGDDKNRGLSADICLFTAAGIDFGLWMKSIYFCHNNPIKVAVTLNCSPGRCWWGWRGWWRWWGGGRHRCRWTGPPSTPWPLPPSAFIQDWDHSNWDRLAWRSWFSPSLFRMAMNGWVGEFIILPNQQFFFQMKMWFSPEKCFDPLLLAKPLIGLTLFVPLNSPGGRCLCQTNQPVAKPSIVSSTWWWDVIQIYSFSNFYSAHWDFHSTQRHGATRVALNHCNN